MQTIELSDSITSILLDSINNYLISSQVPTGTPSNRSTYKRRLTTDSFGSASANTSSSSAYSDSMLKARNMLDSLCESYVSDMVSANSNSFLLLPLLSHSFYFLYCLTPFTSFIVSLLLLPLSSHSFYFLYKRNIVSILVSNSHV